MSHGQLCRGEVYPHHAAPSGQGLSDRKARSAPQIECPSILG